MAHSKIEAFNSKGLEFSWSHSAPVSAHGDLLLVTRQQGTVTVIRIWRLQWTIYKDYISSLVAEFHTFVHYFSWKGIFISIFFCIFFKMRELGIIFRLITVQIVQNCATIHNSACLNSACSNSAYILSEWSNIQISIGSKNLFHVPMPTRSTSSLSTHPWSWWSGSFRLKATFKHFEMLMHFGFFLWVVYLSLPLFLDHFAFFLRSVLPL